jgi:hypothetical protein
MSFAKPKQERPYEKTIQWKGGDGIFSYWNGTENVTIEVDKIIVLEELYSISGYSEKDNKGIWSNEVLNLRTEKMTVKVGNTIVAEGTYREVKDKVKSMGGKFTVVPIALIGDEMVRFLFSGSGCSGWIDKGFNPMSKQCGVLYSGKVEGKKGNTKFFTPTFEPVALTDVEKSAAVAACGVLESWLDSRNVEHLDEEINQDTFDEEEFVNQSLLEAGNDDPVPF